MIKFQMVGLRSIKMDQRHIIIFDGICNFCNNAVNFIIDHDPTGTFVFIPMQSKTAQKLIDQYQVKDVGFDTFLLIKNDLCYFRSNAALEITKDLTGYWHWFQIFKIFPRPIRDYFYKLLAKNRYRLFGKRLSCMIPTTELENRFLK